jgi:DNA-binding MarR family transcriptional regulator
MERLPSVGACEALLRSVRALGWLQRRALQDATSHCTGARAGVLAAVADLGPLRPTSLAGHLHVDNSVVSRQLGALDEDGLVERVADPDDGRAQLVQVTVAGRQFLTGLRQRASARLVPRLAGWSDQDVDTLTGLLSRLEDSLATAEDTNHSEELWKGLTA